MRPCWKPDSSPLRSDQGESRTPTPITARRSERRVSANSTTWPNSSGGIRTHSIPRFKRRWSADCLLSPGIQLRGLESNQHQRIQNPTSYPLDDPGISDTFTSAKVRGEGVEPSSPDSRPGSLPLADPREGGRRGSRTLKAHRSAVFETAAIAHWLALPFQLRRQESNLQSSP